jgi:branched-chain amino acid transport system ATP-binding protein
MHALRIITEEHQNLWRIAITLDQVAAETATIGPQEEAFFSSVFDYIEAFMDACHHAKEDDFLFPVLRERAPDVRPAIERLQAEHKNGPEVLRHLRLLLAQGLASGQKTDFVTALSTYTESLRAHIRTEEKEVMPQARQSLQPEDWAPIDAAFLDNQDPLFGQQAQARFQALFHRIASLAPESVGLGGHEEPTPAPTSGFSANGLGKTLLKVSGLQSAYGRIVALKGLDLEVRQGELVALVGANGAGKTTFLRTLSGVQPMMAGQIQFDGEDISSLRADLRVRRGICQVPEGRQVFGPLTIEDNLRLGAYTRPRARTQGDLERIYALFPILKEKRHLPAGTLSGGQQQMLAIGRALMGEPKMLLLDEPSMGLAPLLVQEVFNVIKRLKAEGITLLLVEQNAFSALAIADRGYVLETGEITLSGTGEELIHNEQVRAAYLGM